MTPEQFLEVVQSDLSVLTAGLATVEFRRNGLPMASEFYARQADMGVLICIRDDDFEEDAVQPRHVAERMAAAFYRTTCKDHGMAVGGFAYDKLYRAINEDDEVLRWYRQRSSLNGDQNLVTIAMEPGVAE